MLSDKEEDKNNYTGINYKFASSTKINIYVNPHENINDAARQEKEKEATKKKKQQRKEEEKDTETQAEQF